MDFRILGPLEVRQAGVAVPLGGGKQRALLAILLLHAGQVISIDRLIDLLWGDEPPETAPNTLQVYISQLRKALEPSRERGSESRVVRRRPGYVLDIDPDQLDSRRFEHLVEDASRPSIPPGAAASTLRSALELWRGPALADFAYEPFAASEIGRLEELRMSAIERRVEADLALGRHAGLVGELEALVEQHPLREGLRAHLMLALYRSGRQAEALHVYQETRRALDEELGIDPGARLQHLQRDILLHDPALEPVATHVEPEPVPLEEELASTASTCTGCGRGIARPGLCPDCEADRSTEPSLTRKTVSVVCCSVEVATGEGHALDPEAWHGMMTGLRDRARSVVLRHGGVAELAPGDHILGVFGVPVVHEDDAIRAARAAVELRAALPAVAAASSAARPLVCVVRVGVNTGELVTEDGSRPGALLGDAVNAAVDLARAAQPNEILVGRDTRRLIRHAARLEATALPAPSRRAPVPSFRLLSAVRVPEDNGRRLNVPMVGRRRELIQIDQAFERSVNERTCNLFTILGAAGVGKTRLVGEFVGAVVERGRIFTGRCPPYGEAVALLPVRDIVKQALGLGGEWSEEEVAARVSSLLGGNRDASAIGERVAQVAEAGNADGPVEEMFWAVRKVIEALARTAPVVLVLDDVHWAEPTLLDLVEHIADWSRGVPILFLCLARPEFLENRPSWGGGKLNASSMLLEPLSSHECRVLLRNLLGETDASPEMDARIVNAAEGNPLFVEEMARMLIDDGYLEEAGRSAAKTDPATIAIPPTIQALLAARLDRLGQQERDVIQRAAVVGRSFGRDAVAELCDERVRPRLMGHLMTLMRKELIRPDHSDSADDSFVFRHVLIREAAYAQLPKEHRARLHNDLAEWLELPDGPRVPDEVLAYHLERAFLYRAELQPLDATVEALGGKAVNLLSSSARAASGRGDLSAAVSFLERALVLAGDDNSRRRQLLLDLAVCFTDLGELQKAESLVRELLDIAAATGDVLLRSRARIQLWEIRSSTENVEGWKNEALREVHDAVSVFERCGDELGIAKALRLEAMIYQIDYRFSSADAALERALDHVRRASDDQEEAKIHYAYAISSLWGPVHVDDAIERYETFLARFQGNRMVEASSLRGMAMLQAMRGRFDEARALVARTRELVSDLGLGLVAATGLAPGVVEMLAGDPAAAERVFRSSYEALQRAGERNARAAAAAYLARSLYEQGRYQEAYDFTCISEELSPGDDFTARMEWASTRAKLLARQGHLEEADELSREVVGVGERTDEIEMTANCLMDRAQVLGLLGRRDALWPTVRQALGLYARKGDVASAGRARALLEELSAPLVIDLREQEPSRR